MPTTPTPGVDQQAPSVKPDFKRDTMNYWNPKNAYHTQGSSEGSKLLGAETSPLGGLHASDFFAASFREVEDNMSAPPYLRHREDLSSPMSAEKPVATNAGPYLSDIAFVAKTAGVFAQACERSGGIVVLNPDFGCLPMIIGRDGEKVLMYEFVEVLHELVSLADIQQEIPSLSYRQIEGGITFLRSLTQFNIRGVDIDAEEEQLLEASPKFQQQIKDALKMEQSRVFTFEQQTV